MKQDFPIMPSKDLGEFGHAYTIHLEENATLFALTAP